MLRAVAQVMLICLSDSRIVGPALGVCSEHVTCPLGPGMGLNDQRNMRQQTEGLQYIYINHVLSLAVSS